MDESEGPEQASRAQRDALMMMDLDVDLDSSFWPFDQIFNSPPWQQPCSPLWAFSDDVKEDNVAGNSRILPCNTDSGNENASKNEKRRKLPVPIVEMTPEDYQDGSCIIKERMTRALRFFKDSTEQHALVQVWAPVKCGGRWVLTTSGQPFFLDSKNNGLYQYRMASLAYIFCVDGETDGVLGIPGRVFRQELPEWSPNVQYYSSQEFPRLSHALHHDVRGTLALPVFDPSVQTCVGVLEIIMTCQKINYGPEVDKVCKALEAVNLKSFEILDHPIIQICNKGRQNALAEILEILTVVCETHNLPFAQTWVPCLHRNVLANGVGLRKTCSSFDGSCMGKICMSTTDVAFYVVDAHIWGFREACAEHHLQKGQGIAGRAFAGHNSCFCEDITRFCKIEYPLVHYARMFGLTSCFAICLQSTYSGDDNYVLEFFLPPNIRDNREQMALLDSLLLTMKQHLGSLRVASGNEIEHELRSTEIVKLLANEKVDSIPELLCIPEPAKTSLDTSGQMMQLDSIPQMESKFEVEAANDAKHSGAGAGIQNAASVAESSDAGKKNQKKRGKAEKTISLEVLQQYFAGSLKEAAKSLGVCPTTMKRICRQHGISRWPSRKINKVNRSLSKLKNVIESVQVTDGTFTLTSFATSSLPVAVGSISWPAQLNAADLLGQPGSAPSEILGNKSALPHEKAENSNQKLDVQAGGDEDLVYWPAGIVTGNDSHMSKTGCGSREDIKESHTYHDSSQSTPRIQNVLSPQNELASPANEQHMKLGASVGFTSQQGGEINVLAAFTMGAFVISEPQEPFGGNLIDDTGSSHDLQNLYSTGEALLDEPVPLVNCWINMPMSDTIPKDSMVVTAEQVPQFSARPEMKTFTIKASYGEDIIRFRLPMNFGIERLKEEVAKRLKLELGTFEIKYLDDDHEWVLIACDADLQECVEILKSSGSSSSLMRLLVHDIMTNLGSSCESYGKCPAIRM